MLLRFIRGCLGLAVGVPLLVFTVVIATASSATVSFIGRMVIAFALICGVELVPNPYDPHMHQVMGIMFLAIMMGLGALLLVRVISPRR